MIYFFEYDHGSLKICIVPLLQLCNPKELFLGLLEQIEQTSGEQVCQTVMLLLQPLQTGGIQFIM